MATREIDKSIFSLNFNLVVCGCGISISINQCDLFVSGKTIFSWSLLFRDVVWRGEAHSVVNGRYQYRCVKNGECVEAVSLRSPIENIAR